MSEVLVKNLPDVNPYDITPPDCAMWHALVDTIESTGVERAHGEIRHTLKAIQPGTGRTEVVTVYIKQS